MPKELTEVEIEQLARKLLTLELTVRGKPIIVDAFEQLQLTDDFDSMMNDVLHWYQLSGLAEAEAEAATGNMKVDIDRFGAELEEYCRDAEVLEKATDQRVKAWINRNEKYVQKQKRLTKLKMQHSIVKHLNRCFYMQYELIRTKSANIRKEYGDLDSAPEKPKKKLRSKTKKKRSKKKKDKKE